MVNPELSLGYFAVSLPALEFSAVCYGLLLVPVSLPDLCHTI